MSWTMVSQYLIAHWVELAGFITTAVGIWLTTKRLLICWPVVLAADIFYFVVFYQARLYSEALLQVFFLAFPLCGGWPASTLRTGGSGSCLTLYTLANTSTRIWPSRLYSMPHSWCWPCLDSS